MLSELAFLLSAKLDDDAIEQGLLSLTIHNDLVTAKTRNRGFDSLLATMCGDNYSKVVPVITRILNF